MGQEWRLPKWPADNDLTHYGDSANGPSILEVVVTAFAKAVSTAFLSIAGESEIFRQIVLLCAAVFFVFVLSLTDGLDLSPGLF